MRGAIFWDFDGTLVYSESPWTKNLHATLCRFGQETPVEKVRQHLRSGYSWHTPEKAYTERTGSLWWEDLFQHIRLLLVECGVENGLHADICAQYREAILRPDNYRLYEDAEETLRFFRENGWHNFVLSNNYPELPEIIEALGLAEHFAGYIVSGQIGYEKPRAEIFHYALELADNPEIAIMVGDNPVADIEGGRNAGLRTVLVHGDAPCPADHICSNLSDIAKAIPHKASNSIAHKFSPSRTRKNT